MILSEKNTMVFLEPHTAPPPLPRLALDDSTHQSSLEESVSDNVRLLRSRTSLNSSLTGVKFTSVDWEVTKTGVCVWVWVQ